MSVFPWYVNSCRIELIDLFNNIGSVYIGKLILS